MTKSLNKMIVEGDFSPTHLNRVKKSLPTFIGYYSKMQFDAKISERETENNGIVYEMKKGKISEKLLSEIVKHIRITFPGKNFRFVTTTPDSGNAPGNVLTLSGFSLVVTRIATELGARFIVPEIIKTMEKQKTQTLSNRAANKRGGYSFEKVGNQIKGKDVLFVDDVITSGATMCAVGEAIHLAGGNFYGYAISGAEMDKDKL